MAKAVCDELSTAAPRNHFTVGITDDVSHTSLTVYPSCQAGCLVATDAGRYVQLIADGRLAEAYRVARAPNPFASVCGRVCAAPCEDMCRQGAIDAPIAIRALKRHLTERYGVGSVRRIHRMRSIAPIRVKEIAMPAICRSRCIVLVRKP